MTLIGEHGHHGLRHVTSNPGHGLGHIGQEVIHGSVDDPDRHLERWQSPGDLCKASNPQTHGSSGQRESILGAGERLDDGCDRLRRHLRAVGQTEPNDLLETSRAGHSLSLDRIEQVAHKLFHVVRKLGIDERVQQSQLRHAVRIPDCPMQADWTAEVVDSEGDLVDAEQLEEPIQGRLEELEVVSDIDRLVRDAKAGQIRSNNTVVPRNCRHDPTPEVGRRRPAVQKQNRRPGTEFSIAHCELPDPYIFHRDGRHQNLLTTKPTDGLETNRPTVDMYPRQVPDGRIEKGKATRERLIAAGRELFGAQGYEGTSIETILEAAGVARGALYHHFPTKEALFDAVVDQVVANVAKDVAAAARAAGTDPVANLRAGCAAWLRMALDPAVQRTVLIDPPAVLGWTRWRQLDEQHTLGGLRRNLERIARRGDIPESQVDVLAHMLLAAVNEAALHIAGAEEPEAALITGQAALDTLLDRLVGP